MASRQLTVTRVFRRNGRQYINFSDKQQLEFSSVEQAREYAASLLEDASFLRKLALARFFFLSPDGSNVGILEGRSITVTNESNNMVTVS